MSSAQVVMSPAATNVCERESRPSALGHFLAKLGGRKTRSKSPVSSTNTPFAKQKMSTITARGSPLVSPAKDDKKPMMLEEPMLPSASFSTPVAAGAAPAKPKRHSSPLSRVVHRLSMNRKHSHSASRESSRERGLPDNRARIFSTISPSAEAVTSPTLSPRPAVSESDLRHVTLRRDDEVKLPCAPLLVTAGAFHSEDNLIANARLPSYLRVSCALNGYRGYRFGGVREVPRSATTLGSMVRSPGQALSSMPMGIVERRALAFNSVAVNALRSPSAENSVTAVERRTAGEEAGVMGAVLNTPTPVRQLVARFDKLQLASEKSTPTVVTALPEKENMPVDEHSHTNGHLKGDSLQNGGTTDQLIEECGALPPQPINPHSTIPLSDQVLGEAFADSVPEPVLAHSVHSGLREKIVSLSAPHQNNHSEITIDAAAVRESAFAEKVHNAVAAADSPATRNRPSTGADFARLLDDTRRSLSERADAAKSTLEQEGLPEHAADLLRVAAGKSTLLLSKKMVMFGTLVEKNMNPVKDDPQPATADDLAGYWALVEMELDDINRDFAEIERMRENGWQLPNTSQETVNPPVPPRRAIRPAAPAPNAKKTGGLDAEKKAEMEKRRREAMAEARRRQRERMQNDAVTADLV